MQLATMRLMHKIDEPRGLSEWRRAAKENPCVPGPLHIGLAIHSMSQGEWRQAVEYLEASGTGDWAAGTIFRAWAHAGARNQTAAKRELERLSRQFPKFSASGKSLFLRHCHPDHWKSLHRLLAPLAPQMFGSTKAPGKKSPQGKTKLPSRVIKPPLKRP